MRPQLGSLLPAFDPGLDLELLEGEAGAPPWCPARQDSWHEARPAVWHKGQQQSGVRSAGPLLAWLAAGWCQPCLSLMPLRRTPRWFAGQEMVVVLGQSGAWPQGSHLVR